MDVTHPIPDTDKAILREFGKRIAEAAAQPVNAERKELWRRLNDLDSVRPMVWMYEQPKSELPAEATEPRCEHPVAKRIERTLRWNIYVWENMQCDMVMPDAVEIVPTLYDTGFGINEDVDVRRHDPNSNIFSRHFNIQIKGEADIEKIKMPEVTHDVEATERNIAMMTEVFDGILPVRYVGQRVMSTSAWDFLVRLTGVEEILMDIYTRPDYVHKLLERLTQAYECRLAQWEELNVLGRNDDHTYWGGGYYYTSSLPQPDFDPDRVRSIDMWGRSMAQIFSAVSPAAHEEFALQYEKRWLNRFGLNYYGCCEPLDRKIDILRKHLPNLRKVSMSPWIDLDTGAEALGTDYVFSWKPNPALLAEEAWHPDEVRQYIRGTLERLKGMHVELILKDISTVRSDPARLTEWARIAVEEAERAGS